MPAMGLEDKFTSYVDEPATYSDAVASSSSDDEGTTAKNPSFTGNKLPNSKPKTVANFESAPNKQQHEEFIQNCVDILLKDAIFEGTNKKNKVLEYRNPEDLQKLFDFDVKKAPSSHEDLYKLIKQTIQYSVKTGHPYFVNQLFSSLDPYGLVGQWLTDALNPSVYTYEVSPVFTLMEEIVLKEMRTIVGFKSGDGIFCPGGSMANGYAISCARFKFMP